MIISRPGKNEYTKCINLFDFLLYPTSLKHFFRNTIHKMQTILLPLVVAVLIVLSEVSNAQEGTLETDLCAGVENEALFKCISDNWDKIK